MNIKEQCNKYVFKEIIELLSQAVYEYNNYDELTKKYGEPRVTKKELFQHIMANTPMGFMLTARITTSYLQLKTIYIQRKNHNLEEWRELFCPWIKTLPLSELITGGVK